METVANFDSNKMLRSISMDDEVLERRSLVAFVDVWRLGTLKEKYNENMFLASSPPAAGESLCTTFWVWRFGTPKDHTN